MATLLDMYELKNGDSISDDFRRRVLMAVVKTAVSVHSEDGQTANHTARVRWAKETLRSPDRMAGLMLTGVCANATVVEAGSGAKDSDIENALAGLVNHYSPEVVEAVV